MKCDVIFYLAKKTALCEKQLKKILQGRHYEVNAVSAATTPESFGMQLTDALQCVNLVFAVGGLRNDDIRGISNVFSKALANSSVSIIPKRIKNPNGGCDGYILRRNSQTIICLPDVPKEMTEMLDSNMLGYLDRVYGFSNQN